MKRIALTALQVILGASAGAALAKYASIETAFIIVLALSILFTIADSLRYRRIKRHLERAQAAYADLCSKHIELRRERDAALVDAERARTERNRVGVEIRRSCLRDNGCPVLGGDGLPIPVDGVVWDGKLPSKAPSPEQVADIARMAGIG